MARLRTTTPASPATIAPADYFDDRPARQPDQLRLRRRRRQLSLTDAASKSTSYTYDPVNRLATVIAADLTTTNYAYDLAGNLAGRTDANNRKTTYAYDADGRRTTVTSRIGQTWTTGYDAAANVTQTVNATATPRKPLATVQRQTTTTGRGALPGSTTRTPRPTLLLPTTPQVTVPR